MMLFGLRGPPVRRRKRGFLGGLGADWETPGWDEDPPTNTGPDFDWSKLNPFAEDTLAPGHVAENNPSNSGSGSGWMDGISNLFSAVEQGFFPKPGAPSTVTVATTPAVVVIKPWYKTPLGMAAIAAGVLGGAYYYKTRKVGA